MKRAIFVLSVVFACWACSDGTNEILQQDGAVLSIIPEFAGTRAPQNYPVSDYFSISSLNNASVSVKAGSQTTNGIYKYESGKLVASSEDNTLKFPDNDASIDELIVLWPEESKRTEIPRDQTAKNTFLAADWLKATETAVSQTSGSVVARFNHERAKLTFTLSGNQAGKKITALTLGNYKAYCDASASVKDAQLMIDPAKSGDVLVAGTFGSITIEGDKTFDIQLSTLPTISNSMNQSYTITIALP